MENSESNSQKKVSILSGRFIFISIMLLLIAGLILFVPAISVLSVQNRKNPSECYYSKSAAKNGFVISYTHSVNKGRVHDFYTITQNKELLLDRTIFVSYGAGIPEPDETPGAEFTVLENGYEIRNLQRIVPALTMAVGIIANHSIALSANTFFENSRVYSPAELFLTDFFAPQTSLILKIKRISLITYISSAKLK